MRQFTLTPFTLGILGAAMLFASAALQAQVIKTSAGPIRGETTGAISAFKGIPYAAPPVGQNRWRSPQPVRPWRTMREAARFGADCLQAPFPPDAAPIRTAPSEDCLFLNVWKPASARSGAGLPVMVWIHGGGFVNGGSSPAITSGENFARDGVVLVSFNYRLGRFGFFAHPGLAAEGYGGNFGFLDQIAALKWVKENIVRFGGDPGRVTIFGESAGGMAVHMLLQSPLARGLFSQAIIQSGGGRDLVVPIHEMARAAIAGEAFAPGLSASQLRALPPQTVTGDLSMLTMGRSDYSGPMLDGRTVFGQPVDAIASGLYSQVPVMVGANSADGIPFVTDKTSIFAGYGADEGEARALYDPSGDASGLRLGTMTSADAMFIEPARAVARGLARRGHKVWLYRFAHNGLKAGEAMGGAPHASEIPYVFDLPDLRREPLETGKDAEVAKVTHRYWVNFARTGRPDDQGTSGWPMVSGNDDTVHLIGSAIAGQVPDPIKSRLDFAERRIKAGH